MAEPAPPNPPSPGRDPAARPPQAIPWRTILAAIAAVAVAYVAGQLIISLQRILTWIVVAGFFAVVLHPAVDFLVYKVKLRRTLAALLVFLVAIASVAGLLYAFIRPIVDQSSKFADNFPHYVDDAKAGKGTVGRLVKKYKIDQWVNDNKDRFKTALQNSGKQALGIAKKVGNTVAALATILVLTYLLLVEGPRVMAGGVGMLSPPTQQRLKRIGKDSARAITGYMAGNLLISLIAGIVTYFALWAFGVPFRTVMALWVGFADLIPLVGATLGAVPTVLVALLHSPTAAVGMIIIYVVYQQFENHVLQVGIMARTVRLSPLAVLVALVAGVQLSGLLGALLAIPLAGVIQVVARDLYQERQRVKGARLAGPALDGALTSESPDPPPVESATNPEAPDSTTGQPASPPASNGLGAPSADAPPTHDPVRVVPEA
jgi:predicted PurR-regulated permease PerM